MDLSQSQTELVPVKGRARSVNGNQAPTKGRKRQLSRGSTTSIHSAATQSIQDHNPAAGSPTEYQRQWFENEQQHRFMGGGHPGHEDMAVMQSASQMSNPREYGIDPALGVNPNHSMAFSNDGTYRMDGGRRSLPVDQFGGSFMEDDSPILDGRSEEQDDMDSVAGTTVGGKKAPKSSAANELEMRQLFQSNKHRTLPEVATELHGNERSKESERIRQVFAMLWINQVCDKGKGSVPRGRVYANYVSRCATERVTVLNPASFGKLVRVLFPGLKTRRLGVRGESKYHYVNFSLKEDQPNLIEDPVAKYQPIKDEPNGSVHQQNAQPQAQTGRAVFPQSSYSQPTASVNPNCTNMGKNRSVYNRPTFNSIQELQSNDKVTQHLKFAPLTDGSMQEYEPVSLPRIEPFVPLGTDPDSATALTALYRSHCTSLIDAIRFVKQKTFFHLFTSFHGTLTMPVQKLFAHPSIAPWIEECDFVMYQKMIRLLSHLTLEVVPQQVLDTLQTISEKLVAHIEQSFHDHPLHVLKAKVKPATLFAGLLDRMYRVNLTAHAAANMLSHSPNRDLMYTDWISMVRPRKIAECIPTRAMDDVVNLLIVEIRELLDPVDVPWEAESGTAYGDVVARVNRETNIHVDSSTENVLDRWVSFLVSLPSRFPYAAPADIIWCVERLGTAVMQDITIRSGASFGSWWVTKCWIDEMLSFMAEKGGFMENKSLSSAVSFPSSSINQHNPSSARIPSSRNGNKDQGRQGYNTQNGNASNGHGHMMMGGAPMDVANQAAMNAAAGVVGLQGQGHDDSGIGMRTPDDDFSMAKFNFSDAQMGTPGIDGGLGLSQPA